MRKHFFFCAGAVFCLFLGTVCIIRVMTFPSTGQGGLDWILIFLAGFFAAFFLRAAIVEPPREDEHLRFF